MKGKYETMIVKMGSTDDWVKLNPGATGFYRVDYPDSMLSRLIPVISSKQLPEVDRLQLQSDLFALVVSGQKSTSSFLRFLKAYSNEDNYYVWNSIDSSIGSINNLMTNTDFGHMFDSYGRTLFNKVYKTLGWEPMAGEPPQTALLRSVVIRRLGDFNDPEVVAEAKKRFEAHVQGKEQISPDMRGTVYKIAASNMTDSEFEKLPEMYSKAEAAQEKSRIGYAMGFSEKESQINRTLHFALSKAVRSQDAPGLLVSVTRSLRGREMAWKFLKTNRDELKSRYGDDLLISRLVKGITSGFASEEMAQEVEEFFKKSAFSGADRAVQQALESIRLKAKWLQRDSESLRNYLSTLA
jgi:puromycin-sensitive aminopeptidase